MKRALAAPLCAALLASGCAATDLHGRAVDITEHQYSFLQRSLSYFVAAPRGADPAGALPLVLFLDGDGSFCQEFRPRLWRRFLTRFTGDYLLVRPRGYINDVCGGPLFARADFLQRVDETALVVDDLAKRYPGRPIYLMGHSAGAHVAILYAARRPDRVAGLVNLAGGVHALAEILPDTPDAIRRGADSPAPFGGRTLRFWHQMFYSGVHALWSSYDKPIFLAHGRRDVASVPFRSVEELARTARPNLTVRFYDAGHDLLVEPVLRDVDRWLAARARGGAEYRGAPILPAGGILLSWREP